MFWIDEERGSEKWNLAAGTINNAEHVVMLPRYLSLGLAPARFLGHSKRLAPHHQRIVNALEATKNVLSTPRGFLRVVSGQLLTHGIAFTPIDLSAHVG